MSVDANYLDANGILKGERIRRMELQTQNRRLLRYDRFRVIVVLLLLCVIILCSFILSSSWRTEKRRQNLSDEIPAAFQVALVISALVEECTASIYYTALPGEPTRDEVAQLKELQKITFSRIVNDELSSGKCWLCDLIDSFIHLEGLLYLETEVIRRSLTPVDVFLAYQTYLMNVFQAGYVVLGRSITSGTASVVWATELMVALSSMASFRTGAAPKFTTPELVPLIADVYMSLASALRDVDVVERKSSLLLANDLTSWSETFSNSFSGTENTGQDVLNQIDVNLTGVSVISSDITASEAVQQVTSAYADLLVQAQKEKSWEVDDFEFAYITGILSSISLFFSVIVLILFLFAIFRVLWLKAEVALEKLTENRAILSLARMNFLLGRVLHLDPEGVRFTCDFCKRDQSSTSAECELIAYSQRCMSLLEFVPSGALAFRAQLLERDKMRGDAVYLEFRGKKERNMMEGEKVNEDDAELASLEPSYNNFNKQRNRGGDATFRKIPLPSTGSSAENVLTNPLSSQIDSFCHPVSSSSTAQESKLSGKQKENEEKSEKVYFDEGDLRKNDGKLESEMHNRTYPLPNPLYEEFNRSPRVEEGDFPLPCRGYQMDDPESAFLPTGLMPSIASSYVFFIVVNIACFCRKVDFSVSKLFNAKIPEFMRVFLTLISSFGGVYIGTSGSLVIAGFSDEDVESSCIQALIAIDQHLLPVFPEINCAVCGRRVTQSIIGSSTLKVFVNDCGILAIVDLLFRIAELYNGRIVIDSYTATKVDTRPFDITILERVGTDESSALNVMTVYELSLHEKRSITSLWNEAFEYFLAGKYSKAKEKIIEWETLGGESDRASRFLVNLHLKQTVTFFFSSEEHYDNSFVFV